MQSYKKQTLGFHKKNKRVWINGGTIQDAELRAGDRVIHRYDFVEGCLIIEKSDEGCHKISETQRGGVIDIVNVKLTNLFKDNQYVDVIAKDGQIIVKGHHAESQIKEREEALIRRVATGEPLRKGGAFAGLGLLCRSIHRGLKSAGVNVKQRFANEYNPIPAEVNRGGNEIWEDAFSDATLSIDDIYEMDMSIVPKLDMLCLGSPCPAFSAANANLKKQGLTDIFHPESGTIFQPILEMIRRSNAAIVLLENSKFFEGSIFDYIMTDVMERFGYLHVSTVVTGRAFGDFEKRERLCRVWYSKGLASLDLKDLPFQRENERSFKDILEPMNLEDKRWARRSYLEAKDAQKHNGHKYCITNLDATQVPTCGANYHKIQADSPIIEHPEKPLVTRIMTPAEHCNLRDINGNLKENIVAVEKGEHYSQKSTRGSASECHRMLGNSVAPRPWEAVGYRLGEWLSNMAGLTTQQSESHTEVDEEQFIFSF